jgi:hypothetical protein
MIHRLLDVTGRVVGWAGLLFNANKLATLHIDGKRKEALPTALMFQGDIPPTLTDDVYEHLGVPTGYHVAQSTEKVLARMREDLDLVDASLPAPWHKLECHQHLCSTGHLLTP